MTRAAPGAAALCVLSGCAGTPDATFELDVPAAIAAEAAWYEIGVFSAGCPSSSILAGGIPLQGATARLEFAANSATPPPLGVLRDQSYGIAAVARAANCSVIATGCAALAVRGSGALAVPLAPVTGVAAGACEEGTSCVDAECVPSTDAGALGASCSLQLVGQGPLADPLGSQSTLLGAPAIAATATGFLLAYREFDPIAGDARLTTISVDAHGAAAPPVQTSLPGCTASPQTDATGLSFSGTSGTLAVSRPPCPGGADGGASAGGVVLFALDATGAIAQSSFSGQAGLAVSLGQGHALADTPAGLLLAYTNASTQSSFAATVTGVNLAASPAPIAFSSLTGFAVETSAYVVGTSYGMGFLAIGSGSVDGGGSSATGASLATEVAGSASPPDASTATAPDFAAQWASASGVGSRILVASSGPSNGASIAWSAFDIGTPNPASTGTFASASGGAVSFVDVAVQQDHAFFAAEVGSGISLFLFEKASTVPVFRRELPFSSLPVIPLGTLRDGLVAVAASDARVAVVWGTGATLGTNDGVGGYAIFACTP